MDLHQQELDLPPEAAMTRANRINDIQRLRDQIVSGGTRYPINPDAPEEGFDVRLSDEQRRNMQALGDILAETMDDPDDNDDCGIVL